MSRIPRRMIRAVAIFALIGAVVLIGWQAIDVATTSAAISQVAGGDQEIAWIDAATSGQTWERFLAALGLIQDDFQIDIDTSRAFPRLTTETPEVSIRMGGSRQRLWIRWYKLTNETGISYWIDRLCGRDPPPVAIVGGSTSDRAHQIALHLQTATENWPSKPRPMFLITTATADQISVGPGLPPVDLMKVYPGHSFRFCFTNRQMAEGVIQFIQSRSDLQPTDGLRYRVSWQDDPYSLDLADRFAEASLRAFPDTTKVGPYLQIPYSVGGYEQPNSLELEAVNRLITEFISEPESTRGLLFLPATSQPARRFLRGLMRAAPQIAGRLTVAVGDSIGIDAVYRDRATSWPIQDLPFPLVLFAHRNPIAEISTDKSGLSGTEDLLMYADIHRAVLSSCFSEGKLSQDAGKIRAALRASENNRFDNDGNRKSGTGEHIVVLLPVIESGQIRPKSILEICQAEENAEHCWAITKSFDVDYE